ncbi:MAG TPA: EAL domain-containing protein, partial [Pyrinomonadaceae bacterium]
NYLKIDRSFVSRLTTDNDNAIVRTISTLARNLGMEVIAEGIETEEQYQQLRMLGCEYGQGYLFSHPVPNEGMLLLVAQDARRNQDAHRNQDAVRDNSHCDNGSHRDHDPHRYHDPHRDNDPDLLPAPADADLELLYSM